MEKQEVRLEDHGIIAYKDAWILQEELMQQNIRAKTAARESLEPAQTKHHFLLCEHPPVYTLGRNGNMANVLLSEEQLQENHVEFYHTNRGGDITFHGPGQVVGYPILDLENFYTDIGRYIFEIEEMVIRTLAEYSITGGRSKGETGVWIDAEIPARARKICAIGIRCSRWITMHGFALNVNTALDYFDHIIPCGIAGKQVTSIETELGHRVDINEVKTKLCRHFESVLNCSLFSATMTLLSKNDPEFTTSY